MKRDCFCEAPGGELAIACREILCFFEVPEFWRRDTARRISAIRMPGTTRNTPRRFALTHEYFRRRQHHDYFALNF